MQVQESGCEITHHAANNDHLAIREGCVVLRDIVPAHLSVFEISAMQILHPSETCLIVIWQLDASVSEGCCVLGDMLALEVSRKTCLHRIFWCLLRHCVSQDSCIATQLRHLIQTSGIAVCEPTTLSST